MAAMFFKNSSLGVIYKLQSARGRMRRQGSERLIGIIRVMARILPCDVAEGDEGREEGEF